MSFAIGNTLRLPIGYFTLGPAFCASTPFEPYGPVYANAWASVASLAARARARGIGILLDFHGLPGGANDCEHSGTNSGRADHWRSPRCRDQSTRCLAWIAEQVAGATEGLREAVVGLQLVNEAKWEAEGLYEWR
ncbi:putative glucan -beta-glucosidase protein [Neofusicoccum parvum UCRNP2]|uniref:Putative glucan-beta-glucosidase protein n=1 Tax=Botryosphaeria parva (strain UCR-NP2) TaxID=1287680 RepID=R1GIF5_BOTPV|nr:putative glucan -beta-glucosidase protein [Neofusicoccum parvum UCRNP2]